MLTGAQSLLTTICNTPAYRGQAKGKPLVVNEDISSSYSDTPSLPRSEFDHVGIMAQHDHVGIMAQHDMQKDKATGF